MKRNADIRLWLRLLALILFAATARMAAAHETSMAFLTLEHESLKPVSVVWKVQYADITRLIDFDADGDTRLQWREVIRQRDEISRTLGESISFFRGKEPCSTTAPVLSTGKSVVGELLAVQFELSCPGGDVPTRIAYSFLSGIDPLHTCAYRVNIGPYATSGIFSDSNRHLLLQGDKGAGRTGLSAFADYVYHGIIHILIGLDHLAFLWILVLSAMGAASGSAIGGRPWKPVLVCLLKYITAFTAAHSITLVASSLGYITLPAKITESIIAASVGWGAYCIIKRRTGLSVWVVFGFGLLHGLGFASVLADLNRDAASNIALLLGFNLGVELGQLLFIATALLVLSLFSRVLVLSIVSRAMAYCILVVSIIWVLERSLEVAVIPFS